MNAITIMIAALILGYYFVSSADTENYLFFNIAAGVLVCIFAYLVKQLG